MAGTNKRRLAILIAGLLCGIASAALLEAPVAMDRQPAEGASAA